MSVLFHHSVFRWLHHPACCQSLPHEQRMLPHEKQGRWVIPLCYRVMLGHRRGRHCSHTKDYPYNHCNRHTVYNCLGGKHTAHVSSHPPSPSVPLVACGGRIFSKNDTRYASSILQSQACVQNISHNHALHPAIGAIS